MEKVLTDNAFERIYAVSEDERIAIFRDNKKPYTKKGIVFNKREAEELHQFLGEWLK